MSQIAHGVHPIATYTRPIRRVHVSRPCTPPSRGACLMLVPSSHTSGETMGARSHRVCVHEGRRTRRQPVHEVYQYWYTRNDAPAAQGVRCPRDRGPVPCGVASGPDDRDMQPVSTRRDATRSTHGHTIAAVSFGPSRSLTCSCGHVVIGEASNEDQGFAFSAHRREAPSEQRAVHTERRPLR